MQITHVAIYTQNLEKSKEYYTNYFHGISNCLYENARGFQSYFIRFEGDVTLELMYHKGIPYYDSLSEHVGISHIAFSVGSKEKVRELTDRIISDGYILYSAPRTTGDGYYESCVSDPDGNRIEITE